MRDDGPGIPAADLPRVFEPVRRASTVGPIRGTGIGLASARQIVEEHGGRIAATSRAGAGTTVVVWLPLDLRPPDAPPDRAGRPTHEPAPAVPSQADPDLSARPRSGDQG